MKLWNALQIVTELWKGCRLQPIETKMCNRDNLGTDVMKKYYCLLSM